MKIAVGFKTLPDLAMLSGSGWKIQRRGSIDLSYVKHEFNCYDESALELALRLAETSPGPLELTALTIDQPRADGFLRHLLALDYHRAVRISPPEGADLRFDPGMVSRLIARYVSQAGGQDLVLLGMQGGMGDNRQTGYLVAEGLGWPCIREVEDLSHHETPGRLKVVSRSCGGRLTRVIEPPAVLIIGNAPRAAFLRVPSVRQRLKAAKLSAHPAEPRRSRPG